MNFPCVITYELNAYLNQLDEEEAYSEACWREAEWIIQLTGDVFISQFGNLEEDFIEGMIELMKKMTMQELVDLENQKANEAQRKGEAFSTPISDCVDCAAVIEVEKERDIDWD
ncbi:hypothetical protein CKO09_11630 [Chromatium weissei]|nr:hypothetical protein [Chromatium weissei]